MTVRRGKARASAFALFLLSVAAADAAPTPEPVATAVRRVITTQLAALNRGDGNAAFALAARGIRAKFGDAATFLALVRSDYADLLHARSVAFGPFSVDGDGAVQAVDIVEADGAAAKALYVLRRENGAWRIDGCALNRPTGVVL